VSSQQPPAPTGGTDQNTEQLLGRILAALEKRHSQGWVELACAIVLALSTMSSAWCAYQSKLWSGVQGSPGGAAGDAVRKAAEDRVLAGEIRAVEAAVFVRFVEAKIEGKDQLADFLASRLLPDTREALAAWWAMKPLTNHEAPRSPFLLPQYQQRDRPGHDASGRGSRPGQHSEAQVCQRGFEPGEVRRQVDAGGDFCLTGMR
jgi:hypothetical protein